MRQLHLVFVGLSLHKSLEDDCGREIRIVTDSDQFSAKRFLQSVVYCVGEFHWPTYPKILADLHHTGYRQGRQLGKLRWEVDEIVRVHGRTRSLVDVFQNHKAPAVVHVDHVGHLRHLTPLEALFSATVQVEVFRPHVLGRRFRVISVHLGVTPETRRVHNNANGN